jgi:ABC-type sugar transport system substrate-binding protein
MVKKLLTVLLCFMFVAVLFTGCKKATTDDGTGAKFHIGVVTGTVSQSEDDLRGGERLVQEYGDSANGGMITTLTYPDNFTSEQETTIAQIVGLADDPLMKAIVVNQSVPGTAEAFKRVREKRPDILLLAGEPNEDPNVIEAAADQAVSADNVARGYLIIWSAKQMGAKTFVHISFPRHMSYELLSRRRYIMEEACKDLGLKFVFETAPDPTSDVGVAGAQQFMLEKTPAWVQKYGKDTAFFCTNDAETEPLLKQLMKYGGLFVEADLPSPLMGYPGALGIDLKAEQGDWPAILKKVEQAVVDGGGSGRFGTWAFSYGYTTTAGLGEYAKRCIEKTATMGNSKDLFDAFNKFTPGATWNGSNYKDLNTGTTSANHVLMYQDTYVFGKGYLGTTKQTVPEKYLTFRAPGS